MTVHVHVTGRAQRRSRLAYTAEFYRGTAEVKRDQPLFSVFCSFVLPRYFVQPLNSPFRVPIGLSLY